ncbi:NDP-hexose 2,3-dehydratase family protein, partial [Streptomyces acidiscabies]|uniref:NDP-hexose 2,3-dehydratase family protein n=1 Tax=Streptomyces acidiscabies TaxID=42234 RepID=UPI0018FEA63A
IVGLSVGATSREVTSWTQPMLRPNPGNVAAFVCQLRDGTLQFSPATSPRHQPARPTTPPPTTPPPSTP